LEWELKKNLVAEWRLLDYFFFYFGRRDDSRCETEVQVSGQKITSFPNHVMLKMTVTSRGEGLKPSV
jgi:hypothetical protein